MYIIFFYIIIELWHQLKLFLIRFQAGAISSDSLSESDSRGGGSNLLDALSLSSSTKLDTKVERAWRDTRNSLNPHSLQIPYVVNACFKHLENYGKSLLKCQRNTYLILVMGGGDKFITASFLYSAINIMCWQYTHSIEKTYHVPLRNWVLFWTIMGL